MNKDLILFFVTAIIFFMLGGMVFSVDKSKFTPLSRAAINELNSICNGRYADIKVYPEYITAVCPSPYRTVTVQNYKFK